MERISDLIPWREVVLASPFDDFAALNPSIHFDGVTWRCVVRCINHPLWILHGPLWRKRKRSSAGIQKRNAMLILDPATWQPAVVIPMKNPPRGEPSYTDIRLFRTARGGLQGIAVFRPDGETLVEQAVVSFDDAYSIEVAEPLRGAWSGTGGSHQKNWSPFDNVEEPCFLCSIDDGAIYDRGQVDPPEPMLCEHGGLRGGSQLVRVGDEWIGIGHEMNTDGYRKRYRHVVYVCDDAGRPTRRSPPFKMSECEIDFVAGLAIDGDRAVVSFGVDDCEARIGETTVAALLRLTRSS